MSKSKYSTRARPLYAALPLPAVHDDRVTRSHLRVLAVVAFYDRLGANGSGCYASQAVISRLAGVHLNNMPAIINDLEGWGFLVIERRTSTLRRAHLRVRYTTKAAQDPWSYPQTTSSDEVSTLHETTSSHEVSEQTPQGGEVSTGKTSSGDDPNTGEIKIHSPEGARSAARSPVDNPHKTMAQLERAIHERSLTGREAAFCEALMADEDQSVRRRAERILNDDYEQWRGGIAQ